MAIEVNEIYQRSGELAFDPARGWVRSYTRTWQVETDDPATETVEVMGSIPVAHGDSYSANGRTDLFSFVQAIRPRCESEDGCTWTVEVQYGPWDPSQRPENPLEQPPMVEWGFAQFERQVDVDQNGVAVLNSAGDPFDPTIVADDSRPILKVTRNEQTFNVAWATEFRDNVNSAGFLGWEPGQAKISNISARRDYHPTCGWYWIVDYEIAFQREGWAKRVLDAGLYEVLEDGTTRAAISDKKGVPVTAPVPLDGNGFKLERPTADNAEFLEFKVYREVDFAFLNFDSIGPIVEGGG